MLKPVLRYRAQSKKICYNGHGMNLCCRFLILNYWITEEKNMGLFDKKYCDICGEKIGLLGNRKLEDGNLCKD